MPVSGLDRNSLFGFVQMLLEIGHEGRATGAYGRWIGRTGLMLAMDVTIGVADMDFPELRQ